MNNIFIKQKKSFALVLFVLVILSMNFVGCKKDKQLEQSVAIEYDKIPNKTSIIGGQPIDIESVPYQAAIFFNGKFNAGGVILNESWILTAAHVVSYPNTNTQLESDKISVRLGSSELNNGGTVYNADLIIRHPNYNGQMDSDIALIHLSTPISFNSNIFAIMYATNTEDSQITIDKPAIISGWGAIYTDPSIGYAHFPSNLYSTNVKISSITPSLIYTSSITSRQQGPCFGDSGGPLVVDISGFGKVLVGVVNGWGDCNVGAKGYARVSKHASWITERTGIDRKFYNKLTAKYFYKRDCQSNVSYPLSVDYIVPANKYSSTISQDDADAKAMLEIDQNGQQNANVNGQCYLTMETPPNARRYPVPNTTKGHRYLQNINWNSSLSSLDSHVKIELIELRTRKFPSGFNGSHIVKKIINNNTPNTGQLINGLDSDLLGNDILGGTYQIKITAINSGIYYLSDDFDLEYDD